MSNQGCTTAVKKSYGRMLLLSALTFAVSASRLAAEPCTGSAKGADVIVVLVDALRGDYLGYAGFHGDITPHLDRLSARSVVFDRAFAQAPWTKPSVASLFTSKNPITHRVFDAGWTDAVHASPLRLKEVAFRGQTLTLEALISRITTQSLGSSHPTLAGTLTAAGYRSAAFVAGNGWISKEFGITRGFEHEEMAYIDRSPFDVAKLPAEPLVARAISWMKNGNAGRPFFTYLHFMDVHSPYRCNPADYAMLDGTPELANAPITDREWSLLPAWLNRLGTVRPEENVRRNLSVWKTCYAAGVREFDRAFGEFVTRLEASGILDRAVLIFLSDHGEEFLEHGKWDHGSDLYNVLLHVPLLVHFPKDRFKGERIGGVASVIDVYPTLLSLLGLPAQAGLQGSDLCPLIDGTSDGRERRSFAAGLEMYPFRISMQSAGHKTVLDAAPNFGIPGIVNDARLQWDFPDGQRALRFDLASDPTESKDLGGVRPTPEALRDEQEIHAWLEEALSQADLSAPSRPQIPERDLQSLRSLGYIK